MKLNNPQITAFMGFLADNPTRRHEMLVACGLSLVDVLDDEIGETPAALAESSSETIVERRPDLVQAWLDEHRAAVKAAEDAEQMWGPGGMFQQQDSQQQARAA
ncbi:hypothetical protein VI03_24865 [Burkholderia vietnamiensis]|uniref:hypothetical protein n=1 Tax=Burkholderia vietnamiensis TaxID=60552 RepID=UPI000622A3CD|nr:hypothetical protein [Burkholderia vietnamiensis]KKI36018.1 hypothetical protein VI03_24865 [Burkholderia vietnamiensis]HDR9174440.1 hypothetical protein [Burkholderia vietnamiensis]